MVSLMLSVDPGRRPTANQLLANWLLSERELELRQEMKENAALKERVQQLERLLSQNSKNRLH